MHSGGCSASPAGLHSQMDIDPATLSQPDRYKLLIGGITPRPIALVSTHSPDGRPNLAPFSFFSGVGSDPLTLLFCPANDEQGNEKDTLRNCKPVAEGGTGEFVVSLASHAYIRQAVAASESLPYGESEFSVSGLSPHPSRVVKPPRVSDTPVAYECRTLQVVRTSPGKPNAGNIVIGEVVHVYVRGDAIDSRYRLDPAVLDTVGRLGGMDYCTTRQRFSLPRGVEALNTRT